MVVVDHKKLEGMVASIRDRYGGDLRFWDFRVFWHNLQLSRRQPEIWHHTERNLSAIKKYVSNGSVMQGLEVLGAEWFKDSIDVPREYYGTLSHVKKYHPDIDKNGYRVEITEHPLVQSHIENFGLDGKVIVIGIPKKNHPYSREDINFTCGPFVFYNILEKDAVEDSGIIDSGLPHELGHVKSSYNADKEGFYEEVCAQLAAGNDVTEIVKWLDLVSRRFQKMDITKDLAKAIVLEERYKALKANQTTDGVDNRSLMCKNLNEALFELYIANGYGNMAQTTGLFR